MLHAEYAATIVVLTPERRPLSRSKSSNLPLPRRRESSRCVFFLSPPSSATSLAPLSSTTFVPPLRLHLLQLLSHLYLLQLPRLHHCTILEFVQDSLSQNCVHLHSRRRQPPFFSFTMRKPQPLMQRRATVHEPWVYSHEYYICRCNTCLVQLAPQQQQAHRCTRPPSEKQWPSSDLRNALVVTPTAAKPQLRKKISDLRERLLCHVAASHWIVQESTLVN